MAEPWLSPELWYYERSEYYQSLTDKYILNLLGLMISLA